MRGLGWDWEIPPRCGKGIKVCSGQGLGGVRCGSCVCGPGCGFRTSGQRSGAAVFPGLGEDFRLHWVRSIMQPSAMFSGYVISWNIEYHSTVRHVQRICTVRKSRNIACPRAAVSRSAAIIGSLSVPTGLVLISCAVRGWCVCVLLAFFSRIGRVIVCGDSVAAPSAELLSGERGRSLGEGTKARRSEKNLAKLENKWCMVHVGHQAPVSLSLSLVGLRRVVQFAC